MMRLLDWFDNNSSKIITLLFTVILSCLGVAACSVFAGLAVLIWRDVILGVNNFAN